MLKSIISAATPVAITTAKIAGILATNVALVSVSLAVHDVAMIGVRATARAGKRTFARGVHALNERLNPA